MQLQYVGFEQANNVRQYIFHGVAQGKETSVFKVSTDMAMFLEFHVAVQDGPILCLHTLTEELATLDPAQSPPLRHRIDERDMRSYLAALPLFGSKKSAAKRPRPEIRPLPK